MQPSLKIPGTGLGSFSLGSRNRGLFSIDKISGTDPRLDGLSLKGNKPLQGGGVNPYPNVLGIHNSGGPRTHDVGMGIALTASKLTPFLPSVALRDRQLRLPLFIDAGLHWYVYTRASGAYVLAPIPILGVPPKAIGAYGLALGCICTGSRNGLLGFVCDLIVPLALFSHFRSKLCLLNPETLEHTHQGIVRNGKRFKTQ
ncbi:hypothetical protein PIB30_100486 [Stylosanthes scabra]|uniref:Uncharacterized protein n=1 Tax=Stylosanthes scabra TaxID=79078 RepID=A0ABU6SZK2_9FABA|nr:hypothetical protein [Stylosanthes scabra]